MGDNKGDARILDYSSYSIYLELHEPFGLESPSLPHAPQYLLRCVVRLMHSSLL